MTREAFDTRVEEWGIVYQIILKGAVRWKILNGLYLHGMDVLITVKRVFYAV